MPAPEAATITPASAGPATNVSEKARFRAALASRSASSEPSSAAPESSRATRATSARSSELAARAAVPSIPASTRIGASEKSCRKTMINAVTSASNA